MSVVAALLVLAGCVLAHGAVFSAAVWLLLRACRSAQDDTLRQLVLALQKDTRPAAVKEAPRQGPIVVENVAVSDSGVTTTYVCKSCGNRFSSVEPRQNTPA